MHKNQLTYISDHPHVQPAQPLLVSGQAQCGSRRLLLWPRLMPYYNFSWAGAGAVLRSVLIGLSVSTDEVMPLLGRSPRLASGGASRGRHSDVCVRTDSRSALLAKECAQACTGVRMHTAAVFGLAVSTVVRVRVGAGRLLHRYRPSRLLVCVVVAVGFSRERAVSAGCLSGQAALACPLQSTVTGTTRGMVPCGTWS